MSCHVTGCRNKNQIMRKFSGYYAEKFVDYAEKVRTNTETN